jgi:hypothetical protein
MRPLCEHSLVFNSIAIGLTELTEKDKEWLEAREAARAARQGDEEDPPA